MIDNNKIHAYAETLVLNQYCEQVLKNKFLTYTNIVDMIPENLSGCYFIFRNAELLYIGESRDIRHRVPDHFSKSTESNVKLTEELIEAKNNDAFNVLSGRSAKSIKIGYVALPSDVDLTKVEKYLIKQRGPKYNKTHNKLL